MADGGWAELEAIYRQTLAACAPATLVAKCVQPDLPRAVVAIGKCAGGLLDGIGDFEDAFAVVPEGYPEPKVRAEVHRGGHPQMTAASFEAGRALNEFVDAHEDVLFLISGGGSACVDLPLAPWFGEGDLMEINERLVGSSCAIAEINCVRKHLSAIKGGRLGARVRGRSETLVYSDVASGALADVASGPTLPDATSKRDAIVVLERLGGSRRIAAVLRDARCPDSVKSLPGSHALLIADNDTLTSAAASIAGRRAVRLERQIECDVQKAAEILLERATLLRDGEVLVAGGEPTVTIRGDGRGGRCCELAVRVALGAQGPLSGVFASSDGRDGNSGVAGAAFSLPAPFDRAQAARELGRSNSRDAASALGRLLTMAPTGNNLRDLYLLARS